MALSSHWETQAIAMTAPTDAGVISEGFVAMYESIRDGGLGRA